MILARQHKLLNREADLSSAKPSAEAMLTLAGRIAEIRSARKELLPTGKIGEPGWDMILALYLATARGHKLTVSNLCDASDAPPTTALRWLDRLLELKMVSRRKHQTDARIVYIELEPEASQSVESFLTQAWATLYPST